LDSTALIQPTGLIAAHEVTNAPIDRNQLSSMVAKAVSALDAETLTVIADPGYYKGEEIVACYNDGITALVPRTDTSTSKAKGRYSKVDFRYNAEHNEYICPAGQRLTYRFDSVEDGKRLWVYMTYQCSTCPLQSKCTTGNARRLKRWEKEQVLDAADALLKKNPDVMRQRKRLVEHPTGRTSFWDDQTLDGVDTLFDEAISERSGRDEPACAHLQFAAGNQHSWCSQTHGSAADCLTGPLY
jgi:hypothetical protein